MTNVFDKVYAGVGIANAITLGGLQPIADTLWVTKKVMSLFKKKEKEVTDEITVDYEIKDA